MQLVDILTVKNPFSVIRWRKYDDVVVGYGFMYWSAIKIVSVVSLIVLIGITLRPGALEVAIVAAAGWLTFRAMKRKPPAGIASQG